MSLRLQYERIGESWSCGLIDIQRTLVIVKPVAEFWDLSKREGDRLLASMALV